MKSSFEEVVQAIQKEQAYQADKYGLLEERIETQHEWSSIMDDEMGEVVEAIAGYDFTHAREEVLQVVTVGINWLMKYGIKEREELCEQ